MSPTFHILMLSFSLAMAPAFGQSDATPYVALDTKGKKTIPKAGKQPHPCVLDTATGLFWEIKTADKGPGDRDWTYTWYDQTKRDEGFPVGYPDGGNCAPKGSCDTAAYVAATNKRRLCGFSDWRLPSDDELSGLLRPDLPMKIDERFFPNSLADYYWTGSYVPLEVGGAMLVSFELGMSLAGNSAAAARLRLVRGPAKR